MLDDETFWRKYAKVYDELLRAIPYRNLLVEIVDRANIQAGMRVLDGCCRTGNLLWALGRMGVECEVTGLDFSKDMLAKTRSKAKKYAGKAEFVLADMDQPVSTWGVKGKFDRIILSNGLYFLNNPAEVLRKTSTVAAPDALLVVATPRPNPSINEVLDEHLKLSEAAGESREAALQAVVPVLQPLIECNQLLFERYSESYRLPTKAQLVEWFGGSGWRILDIDITYAGQDWLVTAVKDPAA